MAAIVPPPSLHAPPERLSAPKAPSPRNPSDPWSQDATVIDAEEVAPYEDLLGGDPIETTAMPTPAGGIQLHTDPGGPVLPRQGSDVTNPNVPKPEISGPIGMPASSLLDSPTMHIRDALAPPMAPMPPTNPEWPVGATPRDPSGGVEMMRTEPPQQAKTDPPGTIEPWPHSTPPVMSTWPEGLVLGAPSATVPEVLEAPSATVPEAALRALPIALTPAQLETAQPSSPSLVVPVNATADELPVAAKAELGRPISSLLPNAKPEVDGYEMLQELGWGAMGVVYEARELKTGRTVALKLIPTHANDNMIQRFVQEARIGTLLDHPDVVKVFSSGKSGRYFYIAMERLYGGELGAALEKRALGLEEAASILARVARALHHVHKQGVLHRDIKPSNIYLTSDGGVKVLDFSVAKLPNTQLTMPGMVNGTPRYMAPEQIRSQPMDVRTDVFALGVLAYELLTGTAPWVGENDTALMMSMCFMPPRPFLPAFLARHPKDKAIGEALGRVIERMISKEPGDRQASMEEVANGFEAVPLPSVRKTVKDTGVAKPRADLLATIKDIAGTSAAPASTRAAAPDEDRVGLRYWVLGGLGALALVAALFILLR